MAETVSQEPKVAAQESPKYYITDATNELDISGGTWDAENGIYRLDKDASGITTEFRLKKYPTTSFYAVSEFKYMDIKNPKTGEMIKTKVAWNKKTKQWDPKPATESMREAFVNYKTLPFKGSTKTEVVNGVPKITLHIEKTKWYER